MMVRYTLRAAALASTCLLPLAAFAQDLDLGAALGAPATPVYTNEVDVGGMYQSESSARFGRFIGDEKKGGYALGGFTVRGRDAWDSGGTQYWEFLGSNLGFSSRSLSAKYGNQGHWGATLFYDGIPYKQSDNFHTLMDSSGNLVNGTAPRSLPYSTTGNPGTTTASNAAQVLAHDQVMSVGTQRDRVGGSVNYIPFPGWTFTAGVQHEHKSGTKENSYSISNSTNINYFPEPVDYDTDRYEAAAQYNTRRLQARFTYVFSKFTDNNTAFVAADPFNNPTTGLASNYLASSWSLPPSNSAHQVKAQLGYNFTPTTRLNANLGYSLMQQDAQYAAGYISALGGLQPNNPAVANPKLPGTSYDGTVQNLFGNVALTAEPLRRTDVRVSYTIDDRINNSNQYMEQFTPADGAGFDTIMRNVPISVNNQTAKLEAGYRILDSTRIEADYTYKDTQRTFAVSDRNHENTVGARINSMITPGLHASLGVSHAVRTASAYNRAAAWDALYYGPDAAVRPPQHRTLNGFGIFEYAARTRDEIKGSLSYSPSEVISGGLIARFYNDHFPNDFYGVGNDHTIAVGPDIAYTPMKNVTAHFYYTYEEIFTDMGATNFGSLPPSTAAAQWKLGNMDTVHTVGLLTNWQATSKLKLGVEDNLSYGNTAFNEGAYVIGIPSPTNTVTQLPDDKSFLNTFQVHGEYQFTPAVSLWAGYTWERFMSKDYLNWQLAAAANQTTANTYSLPGDGNPSYSVHVVGASMRVKW